MIKEEELLFDKDNLITFPVSGFFVLKKQKADTLAQN